MNPNSAYVSLYNRRLPQFNSFRNSTSGRSDRTPVAAIVTRPNQADSFAPPPGAGFGGPMGPNSISPPPGYDVASPTIDFLAILTVANTATDYASLALLIISKEEVTATLVSFGLIVALLLRIGAVYQYFEQVNILSRVFNVFFGSRFGWKEKFDFEVIKQVNIGVQFGFPLVMHAVSDLIQHGFTFYPIFILIIGGKNADVDFLAFFVFSLIVTGINMLGALLIRLSYGASLISLSLLAVYASLMLAFVLANQAFNIEFEDKVYTKGVIFPWVKFISIIVAGFTTTAVEVRRKQRIILPNFLTSLIAIFFVADVLAICLVNFNPGFFIDENAGEKITDDGIVVDQLIYANTVYDFYVGLYMFVQWRLLLFGGIN